MFCPINFRNIVKILKQARTHYIEVSVIIIIFHAHLTKITERFLRLFMSVNINISFIDCRILIITMKNNIVFIYFNMRIIYKLTKFNETFVKLIYIFLIKYCNVIAFLNIELSVYVKNTFILTNILNWCIYI